MNKLNIDIAQMVSNFVQKEIMEVTQATHKATTQNLAKIIQYMTQNTRHKFMITGMGKSAIVAKKIASTFTSLDIPAIYIHAADLLHGNLGLVTNWDMLMFISNSGEAEEFKLILEALKARSVTIIGMTGNKKSFLAKNSSMVIHVPVESELDSTGLAPTTSCIAQLVMGDVIACCIQEIRSQTKDQFLSNHPGGIIGSNK